MLYHVEIAPDPGALDLYRNVFGAMMCIVAPFSTSSLLEIDSSAHLAATLASGEVDHPVEYDHGASMHHPHEGNDVSPVSTPHCRNITRRSHVASVIRAGSKCVYRRPRGVISVRIWSLTQL